MTIEISGGVRRLLLVTTLNSGLFQQLAVLLLCHPLTTLLDDRAHVKSLDFCDDLQIEIGPLPMRVRPTG